MILTVGTAFFLAELGDKTMLATVTLATHEDALGTWLGSTAGMVAADAIAIGVGKAPRRRTCRSGRSGSARLSRLSCSALILIWQGCAGCCSRARDGLRARQPSRDNRARHDRRAEPEPGRRADRRDDAVASSAGSRSGRLPARRVGGRWRVASDALDAFMASGRPVEPAGAGRSEPRDPRASSSRTAARSRPGSAGPASALGIVAIAPPTDGPDAVDLLDVGAVVAAAARAGADAVHPGFGFLAENADFAEAVEAAGIRWIGPPPAAIRAMGDKAAARRLARGLGVPIVPGYDGDDQDDAALVRAARRIGYPILVKPAAGGGGKGMRTVRAAPPSCAASSPRPGARRRRRSATTG